ncbi:DNA translocase FtsK [Patescibacteria group bacterium]|nr:DNA translocase FtsK [Patescibacteria group bacterium]
MAVKIKKTKKSKEKEENGRWHDGLKEETKHSVWAVICLGVSLFLLLVVFGKAGMAGVYVRAGLEFLFGDGLFLAPAIFFFAAISLFSSFRPNLLASNLVGGLLVFLSGLALVEVIFGEKSGGHTGYFAAFPFLKLIDFWATLILFLAILSVGFLIMFNLPISFSFLRNKLKQQKLFDNEEDYEDVQGGEPESVKLEKEETYKEESYEARDENTEVGREILKKKSAKIFGRGRAGQEGEFQPPPLDLLEGDKGKPSAGDIKANSNIIKRTFQNFGINIEMAEICIGPSVTQYSIKPAEGIKLSRIVSLNNDLALALAAHPIRIEAPIPGKSLVGIEVPNRSASLVGLKHLLREADALQKEIPLLIAMGRNVAGKPVFSSISKMPHLLIAGATGSGKSVCIHALMMSLLYRHSPAELQFLLIDPKRVEMNIYNDLPYLLSPVIVDAKKAIVALRWATKEMERRYDVLLGAGARDVNSYRKKNTKDSMPYLVIVIDELADIMATYPREFEASIVRLAQMSRAVGIHLVVSTQRPSVDVITGLIKANITTRIAFQVASQVDSRTILDMAGAERLLGNGDMLFLSADSTKPRRIQGSFVSESEVKKVVDYLRNKYEDSDSNSLGLAGGEMEQACLPGRQASIFDGNADEFNEGEEDELYEEARALVIEAGKGSSSYLQRRLRVGYARAARLLDMLEERGVVGPPDGSKSREVLVEKPSEDY